MEYAINFGTSNTVVAKINENGENGENGEIEAVKLADYCSLIADNPPLIPSFVYVKGAVNEKVIIGQEVSDRRSITLIKTYILGLALNAATDVVLAIASTELLPKITSAKPVWATTLAKFVGTFIARPSRQSKRTDRWHF